MALPWAEVNAQPPALVRDLLGLPKSPKGGKKRMCPFCGGRNFSAIRRAFYCHSGCGGHAYSNVNTAAQVWRTDPADACRRLATALGVAWSEDPPPWDELRDVESLRVAAVLGLEKAEGPWMWNCPCCAGAGTLKSFRVRWQCGGACGSDDRNGWKNHVDVAMHVWRTTPVDACYRLTAALRGEGPPAPRPTRIATAEADVPSPAEQALEVIRARPGATLPDRLYSLLLQHLTLGPLGRAELERRRLDPAEAAEYGFRSVEADEWRKKVLPLMAAFADDELCAAGFPRRSPRGREDDEGHPPRTGRPWWPGFGRAPLLVIPYRDGDRVFGIRFRNLADPEKTRCPGYASPKDAQPTLPFHAAAAASATRTLHVVEGDLNAWSLVSNPYRAPAWGLPGAATWCDAWVERIPDDLTYLVGWFDNDKAGRAGALALRNSVVYGKGEEWTRRRWRLLLLAKDACDLHRDWELARLLREQPWMFQDTGPLWVEPVPERVPPVTTLTIPQEAGRTRE